MTRLIAAVIASIAVFVGCSGAVGGAIAYQKPLPYRLSHRASRQIRRLHQRQTASLHHPPIPHQQYREAVEVLVLRQGLLQ